MVATRLEDKVNITVSVWGEGGLHFFFHTPKGSFKNSIYLLFSIGRNFCSFLLQNPIFSI